MYHSIMWRNVAPYLLSVVWILLFAPAQLLYNVATLPKQVPQPPQSVSTTLDVTYAAPLADSGSDILNYRVELDVTNRFLNPIHILISHVVQRIYIQSMKHVL